MIKPSIRLNVVVFAAIPDSSVRTATKVNVGVFAKPLKVWFSSRHAVPIIKTYLPWLPVVRCPRFSLYPESTGGQQTSHLMSIVNAQL